MVGIVRELETNWEILREGKKKQQITGKQTTIQCIMYKQQDYYNRAKNRRSSLNHSGSLQKTRTYLCRYTNDMAFIVNNIFNVFFLLCDTQKMQLLYRIIGFFYPLSIL